LENKTTAPRPQIHESWFPWLEEQFSQPYFSALKQFLVDEKAKFKVYPPGSMLFKAFNKTPFEQVKVVILGQDPYHGEGQAEGLSFSVAKGIKIPPSLVNIFTELQNDLGYEIPAHGSLGSWAESGVLLLNTALSVRAGEPTSHRNQGWEIFTDFVIRTISENREHVVFILWGKFAHEKESFIDHSKHLVLKAPHPSPYSAAAGFFGSKHFSKANAYLEANGIEPVNWKIED
jgi:uracil-DNA glycosylase